MKELIIHAIIPVIISTVSSFYTAAAATVFLRSFFDQGIAWGRKKAMILGIFVIIEAALNMFFPGNAIVTSILFIVYVFIPVYDCKGKKIRRALKVAITYMTFVLCCTCIFLFSFLYLLPGFDIDAPETSYTESFLMSVSSCIFVAFVFHYLKKRILSKELFVRCGAKIRIAVIFYVIFLFSMYMIAIISVLFKENEFEAEVILASVCILFMVAFPIILFHSRISSHYRRMNDLSDTYLRAQLEHFRQYKSAQEETARFRHDIRNNLVCIDTMLDTGKTEEAAAYLKELLDEVRSLSPEYVSGDEMLDCIISAKASSMKENNIEFSFDGVFAGGLSWSPVDICSVFANALDNAVEACCQMPEGERKISMTIRSADQFCLVNIQNSTKNNVDIRHLFDSRGGYTTKEKRENHGLGTYNIKRTVEKYGGMVSAKCENGIFTLELMIKKNTVA